MVRVALFVGLEASPRKEGVVEADILAEKLPKWDELVQSRRNRRRRT